MNLIFMGDLHAADKPPSGRVDNYIDTVLGKLASIAMIASHNEATAVISLGDIFHSKQANRVSDTLRQRLIEMFKAFPCPVYVVPGNHDMGPAGLDSLSSQPLGTLEKAGAVTILRDMMDMPKIGVWIVPRPYNTEAEGFHTGNTDPSYYSLTEEEKRFIGAEGSSRRSYPVIGVAHGSLLPPGDTRQYPYVDVSTIPGIEDYDLYVAGHIHEPLGNHLVGTSTIFANPGSVMRTSRDLMNYARQVQVLSVDVTDNGLVINEIPIPGMAPALEVFGRKESSDTPDVGGDDISNFIGLLGQGLRADSLSIPDLLAEMDMKIEPRVKAEVQRHLEEAST